MSASESVPSGVPPSPLAPVPPTSRQCPLPWSTPALTVAAAGVAIVVGLHDPFGVGGLWWLTLGLNASLLGVGATAADHALASWRRAWRWALGMCLTGLLPLGTLVSRWRVPVFQTRAHLLRDALWEVISFTAGAALLGLVLAWAARARRARHAKLALVGLLSHAVGSFVLALSTHVVGLALGEHVTPPRQGGGTPFTALCLFGMLFGLALAEGLRVAERAEHG